MRSATPPSRPMGPRGYGVKVLIHELENRESRKRGANQRRTIVDETARRVLRDRWSPERKDSGRR
jgi:hypothetical protein